MTKDYNLTIISDLENTKQLDGLYVLRSVNPFSDFMDVQYSDNYRDLTYCDYLSTDNYIYDFVDAETGEITRLAEKQQIGGPGGYYERFYPNGVSPDDASVTLNDLIGKLDPIIHDKTTVDELYGEDMDYSDQSIIQKVKNLLAFIKDDEADKSKILDNDIPVLSDSELQKELPEIYTQRESLAVFNENRLQEVAAKELIASVNDLSEATHDVGITR